MDKWIEQLKFETTVKVLIVLLLKTNNQNRFTCTLKNIDSAC